MALFPATQKIDDWKNVTSTITFNSAVHSQSFTLYQNKEIGSLAAPKGALRLTVPTGETQIGTCSDNTVKGVLPAYRQGLFVTVVIDSGKVLLTSTGAITNAVINF